VGAHPLFSTLSRRGLNPIKLAHSPSLPDNGLGQYVSSPGNRAYCYAELAVSSFAIVIIMSWPESDRPILNLPTLEGWKAELTLVLVIY